VNIRRMRSLVIAAGLAGLLATSVGTASAQVSTQAGTQRALWSISTVGGGWREGPFATDAACLVALANAKKNPYVISASCDYLTYSPFTGLSDPGWYLWTLLGCETCVGRR
jgi:hypothetical protein